MLRIGAHAIPETPLGEAAEGMTAAYRVFGVAFSRNSLAGLLQLNGRGGWFAALLGSMRGWGLVEGRGALRLTERGLAIARAGSEAEQAEAKRAVVLGVPLLNEIAARSPHSVPRREDLALMLSEITGADAGRVHTALGKVRKVLLDAWPVADAPGEVQEQASGTVAVQEPAGSPAGQRPASVSPMLELSYSGGRVSLPETRRNLEIVADLLKSRAKDLSKG